MLIPTTRTVGAFTLSIEELWLDIEDALSNIVLCNIIHILF